MKREKIFVLSLLLSLLFLFSNCNGIESKTEKTIEVQYCSDQTDFKLNCKIKFSKSDSTLMCNIDLEWPIFTYGENLVRKYTQNFDLNFTAMGVFRNLKTNSIYSIDKEQSFGHFKDFLWIPNYNFGSYSDTIFSYTDYIFDIKDYNDMGDPLSKYAIYFKSYDYSNIINDTLINICYEELNYNKYKLINSYNKNFILVKFLIKVFDKEYLFTLSKSDYDKIIQAMNSVKAVTVAP